MEITLGAVIEAARLRRAGITAEVAGYLVLLAVQEVRRAPRRVGSDALLLTELGELRVLAAGAPAPEADIEADLRQLLATLTALAHARAPALEIAAERSAAGNLGSLEAELLAALIPINHAAARRALARLYREAHKSRVESLSLAAESRTLSTPSPAPAAVTRPSSADRTARTPTPASVARVVAAPASAPTPAIVDLEIEVDVVGVEEPVRHAGTGPLAPLANASAPDRSSPVPPAAGSGALDRETLDEPASHRSDLRELLAGFLAHTRSEEQMTADLRRMIGLEAPPLHRPSSAPPPLYAGSGHLR